MPSTMTALGRFSALAVLVINFTCGEIRRCDPHSQEFIKCEYSTDSADCPARHVGPDLTPLGQVSHISTHRYLNNKTNYTGVTISWNSPDSLTLNATGGYILSLYYTPSDGTRVLLLCRHLNVWYTRKTVRIWEAEDYKFAILEPSLPLYNTLIMVELETLPSDPTVYTSSLSTYNFTTLGNPSDRFPINGTGDTSTPYEVTVLFKQTSYDPYTRMLYNHTRYMVGLYEVDRGLPDDINGDEVKEIFIAPNNNKEYAAVTFSHIRPEKYLVEVWPWLEQCSFRCRNVSDLHQISFWNVNVKGYDYEPAEAPRVVLTRSINVKVIFLVAPSELFIDRYKVTLFQQDKLLQEEVTANQSDVWYTYNVTFSIEAVLRLFNITDPIRAKVLPIVNTNLCTEPGLCNLNGTCTPCKEHISRPLLLTPAQKEMLVGRIRRPPSSDLMPVLTIVLTVVAIAVVVALVTPCIYKKRMLCWHSNDNREQPVLERNTPDDGLSRFTGMTPGDGISLMIFGHQVKTCVAFAAGQHSSNEYQRLYTTLSKIMNTFFSCPLTLYSEVCRRNSLELRSYDVALVFCTPELYEMHKKLETSSPEALPQDEFEHCRVRDLLLAPRHPEGPTRILVTFDHVPTHYVKELTAGESAKHLDVYNLPDGLEQLVTAMYTRETSESNAKVTTWKHFCENGKDLSEKLARNIKQLGSVYQQIQENLDSGYAETMTITTQQQISRLGTLPEAVKKSRDQRQGQGGQRQHQVGQRQGNGDQRQHQGGQRQHHGDRQQPANGQLVGQSNGERLHTITQPLAEEMAYLRENSADIPPHIRQRIHEAQLAERGSVYTVDSELQNSRRDAAPVRVDPSPPSENSAPPKRDTSHSRENPASMNYNAPHSRENPPNSGGNVESMNRNSSRRDENPSCKIPRSRDPTESRARDTSASNNHQIPLSSEDTESVNYNNTSMNYPLSRSRENPHDQPLDHVETQPLVSRHTLPTLAEHESVYSVDSDQLVVVASEPRLLSKDGKPVVARIPM